MANKIDDYANQEMVKRVGSQGAPKGAPLHNTKWSPPAGAPLCKYKSGSSGKSKKGKY
jgi:hypothetical protein